MIGNFARSNENTDMDVVAMQRPAASSSFCDDEQSQFMSPYRQPPRMPDKQEYDPLSALELSSDEENEVIVCCIIIFCLSYCVVHIRMRIQRLLT